MKLFWKIISPWKKAQFLIQIWTMQLIKLECQHYLIMWLKILSNFGFYHRRIECSFFCQFCFFCWIQIFFQVELTRGIVCISLLCSRVILIGCRASRVIKRASFELGLRWSLCSQLIERPKFQNVLLLTSQELQFIFAKILNFQKFKYFKLQKSKISEVPDFAELWHLLWFCWKQAIL